MKLNRFVARTLGVVMVLGVFGTGVASAAEVNIIDVLLNGKTAQAFTDASVAEGDLNTILLAGVNGQSAMNSQPWHFSVITTDEALSKLGGGMGGPPRQPTKEGGGRAKAGMSDASVAIVISCSDSLRWNSFDAGGACDRMSVAALALGYGTKIVAAPCDTINASPEYRALCGIPDDMNAIAVLLIGGVESPTDTVSGATTRRALEDVVTFVSE